MKAQPLYARVLCKKIMGGKRALWHAWQMPDDKEVKGSHGSVIIGAGNTGDNAIKDLAKALLCVKRRYEAAASHSINQLNKS